MHSGQELLLSELIQRKKRNPNYSLRSFARDLGISPGHLSSLINRKKRITVRQATLLASKLNLSTSEKRDFFQSLIPFPHDPIDMPPDQTRLHEDEFALISDWWHLAVLNLASIKSARSSPRWIARRLNISDIQAIEAIQRLERLGFISQKNGRIQRLAKPLRTSTEIPSEAIRRYHKQNLDLAKEKIDAVPIDLREFSSMTMPINLRKLSFAKKLINEFKERLCKELEVGELQEVYTLCIQLFPITNQEDKK